MRGEKSDTPNYQKSDADPELKSGLRRLKNGYESVTYDDIEDFSNGVCQPLCTWDYGFYLAKKNASLNKQTAIAKPDRTKGSATSTKCPDHSSSKTAAPQMMPRRNWLADTRHFTVMGVPSGSPSSLRCNTLTVMRLPHGKGGGCR